MKSINPYSEKVIKTYASFKSNEIFDIINEANNSFNDWKNITLKNRINIILKIKQNLIDDRLESAKEITSEMGKPLSESLLEIDKCVWLCDYYIENSEKLLKPEFIKTEAHKSYITFEPLGIILGIMPWNFPFWQVFRFVIPTIISGNVTIIKHAPNVTGCCLRIKKIFSKNINYKVLQPLVIDVDEIENIIKNPLVKGVSLTGSDKAGSAVAKITGKYIKKTLLELGGSDAFIVCKDADVDKAAKKAVIARMLNTGQSCIAGKRLLLHERIAEEFMEEFVKQVKELKSGDTMDEDTFIGTLAREDLAEDLEKQIQDSVKQGAKIVLGGKRDKAYYEPTIITNVKKGMPVFDQETFGPAMAVTTFKEDQEAIDLVNYSDFGLGVSIFTEDFTFAEKIVPAFEDGAVFVNELVKSDPRLPFGGTKISGYGRELSSHGIQEFVNRKTVYFNKY